MEKSTRESSSSIKGIWKKMDKIHRLTKPLPYVQNVEAVNKELLERVSKPQK